MRTGRIDLKFDPSPKVLESARDCFNCSFSERSQAFLESKSLFCWRSLGKLLIKEIWVAVAWRRTPIGKPIGDRMV